MLVMEGAYAPTMASIFTTGARICMQFVHLKFIQRIVLDGQFASPLHIRF